MTPDQQLFEKVKRDGECWHKATQYGWCDECAKDFDNPQPDFTVPDFTTWEGFGWLWERAQEKEWWEEFQQIHCHYGISYDDIRVNLINPIEFRNALMEFHGIKEEEA